MLIGVTTMVETSNLIMDDESSSNDDEDELLVGDINADSPTPMMMLIWMQFS